MSVFRDLVDSSSYTLLSLPSAQISALSFGPGGSLCGPMRVQSLGAYTTA